MQHLPFSQTFKSPTLSTHSHTENNLIGARTDEQAAHAFIEQRNASNEPKFSDRTRANYLKEIRRLLIFCNTHQYSFDNLNYQATQHYTRWIAEPPTELISTTKYPLHSEHWRPFTGPLSSVSIHQSIAALKSMFNWLQKAGYVRFNPFAMIDTNTQERRLATAQS